MPIRSCSASSKRPWRTRISARRAAGGTQRERWPASVELADRRDELLLGGVDPAVRGEDIGAARAAEREERDVVVSSHELLENLAPLLWPLGVARPLTREHQGAADVGERLETCGLTTCRRSHGLVEMRKPPVDSSECDLGEPELGERAQLEVGVARPQRDIERSRCQAGRLLDVSSLLGTRQVKPPFLGARRYVAKQALGPSEPTTRSRVVSERECVLARKPKCDPRSACELAVASKTGVRPLARNNGITLLAEPPKSATEPVERLRELLDDQRRLKRRAGRHPVARSERLVAPGNPRLRRSRSHP